uniref:EF-hand domain-containing protein n=1 Tax=Vespula pensylvanica TaxID=30213 RepID=A0A834U9V5_VESPE|nr:hypothetical protein H0235_009188 [Vespula pensylvanica]
MWDNVSAQLLISLRTLSITFSSQILLRITKILSHIIMWDNDDMQEIDLSKDQLKHLRMAFDTFDPEKKGAIQTTMIPTILEMLGHEVRGVNLQEMIATYDLWGSGELKFEEFSKLASRFMEEDTDTEAVKEELREAFRIYDKEGNGYITTDVFRDILHELDDQLSPEELDMIIEEVDTDGSGTLDFEGLIVEFSQAPLERSLMSLEIRLGAFNEVEIC